MTVSTFYTLVRFYQPDLVDFKQGKLVHWIDSPFVHISPF